MHALRCFLWDYARLVLVAILLWLPLWFAFAPLVRQGVRVAYQTDLHRPPLK